MVEVIRHELVVRSLRIVRISPLTRGLTRVSAAGPELQGFRAPGPGDHIKVTIPVGSESVRRDLTPVTEPGHLDDVVHLDIATAHDGPLTQWLGSAAIGDSLRLGGPRSSRLAPPEVSRAVLVADAAAFPAIARWLCALADHGQPHIVVHTVGPEDFGEYLEQFPDSRAHALWKGADCSRHEQAEPVAVTSALRERGPRADETVILLGEANIVAAARRLYRREFEYPAEHVHASGYWKLGVAEYDHHAPLDDGSVDGP